MEIDYIKRAKSRRYLAHTMLALALFIIVTGIIIAIILSQGYSFSLGELKLSEANKNNIEALKMATEAIKYKYTTFTVMLLSMLFFIAQALLSLYRYNMLKADFYLACSDSYLLTKELDENQKKRFESLLTKIIKEKISLSNPKTPTFSFFSVKSKET